jgi:diguanylate cyclase (GGDEF)-like protein
MDGSPDELTIALLNRWNLPSEISEAVRGRWLSLAELKALPETPARASTHVLALATAVGAYLCEAEKGYALVRINELASQLFGMTPDQAQSFLGNVQRDLRDNSQLFQIDVSSIGAQADIMAEAMEQLAQLAARGHRDPEARAQEHLHDENSRLKQQIEELLRRNSVDALTGAFNRGHFDGQLRQFIEAAKEAREPVGLLFLDADHSKKVNDTYGHAVGDIVLKKIAGVLMHTARRGDLVARYGGEEFVILLVNPTPEGLIALGERARSAIERETIETAAGPLKVTISVGGAIVNPREHANCETALPSVADKALYAAKRNGRNRLEIGEVAASCQASG